MKLLKFSYLFAVQNFKLPMIYSHVERQSLLMALQKEKLAFNFSLLPAVEV